MKGKRQQQLRGRKMIKMLLVQAPPTAATHNQNNKNSLKKIVLFYPTPCVKIAEVNFSQLLLPWQPADTNR